MCFYLASSSPIQAGDGVISFEMQFEFDYKFGALPNLVMYVGDLGCARLLLLGRGRSHLAGSEVKPLYSYQGLLVRVLVTPCNIHHVFCAKVLKTTFDTPGNPGLSSAIARHPWFAV